MASRPITTRSGARGKPPAPDTEDALRLEIVATCQALERHGLVQGTSGNVSVRLGDGLLITPSGVPYDQLGPADIVRLAGDGRSVGRWQPSSEWRFHRDILAKRPDLEAVVHTHSTHATAVSILRRDIPAIHYSIAAAGGSSIRCAPYALFGSQALADLVVTALEGRRACLLAHHGVVAAHTSLARALDLARTVEELARQYLLCLAVGEPPVLDDPQMAEAIARFATYGQQPKRS
jgi:L-fuculose-phosphate aldolase